MFMAEPYDLFHELSLSFGLGGRFDYNSGADEASRSGFVAFRDEAVAIISVEKSKIPYRSSVHFDYFNHGQLNAVAFADHNYGFVGVAWGTLSVLAHLFAHMLARKDVLPHIGDPEAERREPPR